MLSWSGIHVCAPNKYLLHTTDRLKGDHLGAAVCIHLNTGGSHRTEYTVRPAHNNLELVAAAGPTVGPGPSDNLLGDRVGWLVVG